MCCKATSHLFTQGIYTAWQETLLVVGGRVWVLSENLSCLAWHPKEPRWLCKDRECDLPVTAATEPISEKYGTMPKECATFHIPAFQLGVVCIDNRHRFLGR